MMLTEAEEAVPDGAAQEAVVMTPNWQALITHLSPFLGSVNLIGDDLFKEEESEGVKVGKEDSSPSSK